MPTTKQAPSPPLLPSPRTVAQKISEALNETGQKQRAQIMRLTHILGPGQALEIYLQAKEIRDNGGMLTNKGDRTRTFGGIWFHLVYTTGKSEDGSVLKRTFPKKKTKAPAPQVQKITQPPVQSKMAHTKILPIKSESKGQTNTMKATLIGRLTTTIEKDGYIAGTMTVPPKTSGFPKGVPVPQPDATYFVVHIGKKQWSSVAEAAKDQEDALILEGYAQPDFEAKVMRFYATNVTSKKIQAARLQAKPAQEAKA